MNFVCLFQWLLDGLKSCTMPLSNGLTHITQMDDVNLTEVYRAMFKFLKYSFDYTMSNFDAD